MNRTWMIRGKEATRGFLAAMALVGITGMALMLPSPVAADSTVSMTDYTSSPPSVSTAASGSSVSVLATSFTGEGAAYQAFFFPSTSVTIGSNPVLWTGYTQGLFIDTFGNLREDYSASGCTGPPDGKLVLIHDCIVKFRLDTNPTSPNFNSVVVDRFKDDGSAPGSVAGDGIADTTTPFQTVALSTGGVSNVQPIWEGGRRLALLTPGATCEGSTAWPISGNMSQGGNTCRRILTWADFDNDGLVSISERVEFRSTPLVSFALCPYLGGNAVLYCNGDDVAAITAGDIKADPNLGTALPPKSDGTPGCLGITHRACALIEATNIINWVRGSQVPGLRDRTFNVRNDSGAIVRAQWKLGDVVNATPVVVGAPSTRFDVIYGDQTYATFFQRYKDRRQVAYVGANDGMLHAFNGGFFNNDDRQIDGTGPTVQARFTTTPKQLGTSTDCAALPCDGSVTTYSFRSDAPPLGAELWAFIPQDLLPQLRWLTATDYDHVYFVDLTPKVTDVRIFTPDADHPGGWGTILIGGFRLGGSCTNCTSSQGTPPVVKGRPRVVQADFNNNGTTTDTGNGASGKNSDFRVFLSSYFVLDITNPEKEPRLLWVFRDQNLGLTTADPGIVRVNPVSNASTSSTNERWFAVFGTGPTHYDDVFSTQTAQFFAVDLKLGPAYSDINKISGIAGSFTCSTDSPCIRTNTSVGSGAVRAFSTGQTGAFMADAVTLDVNLDFRVDVIYAGSVICNVRTPLVSLNTFGPCTGPDPKPGVVWRGAMWRLTTNGGDTNPDNWGIFSAGRVPTKVISTLATTPCTSAAASFTGGSPCQVGPITAAPTLTQDDTNNVWLFFGTGRYYTTTDKCTAGIQTTFDNCNVDIQHFFGVKDCIVSSACSDETVERNNLFNVSNVVTCSSCAAGTNVSTTGSASSFTIGFSAGGGSLVNNVQNGDGWFTTFNDPTAPLQTPPRSALTPGERNLASATLLGGTVFFTSFIPTTDIRQASGAVSGTVSGTAQLYAVFYLTGGPYPTSTFGTALPGSDAIASKSIALGKGVPSQLSVQIGAQGNGAAGTSSSSGCVSCVTGFYQTSMGVLVRSVGGPHSRPGAV